MFKHRFYQVDSTVIQEMNIEQVLDYVLNHESTLAMMSISDKVVLRNIDTDDNCRTQMRFFSSIYDAKNKDIRGINYHGVTIINTERLRMVVTNPGAIRIVDMYVLARLKLFFREAYENQHWIVHLGI